MPLLRCGLLPQGFGTVPFFFTLWVQVHALLMDGRGLAVNLIPKVLLLGVVDAFVPQQHITLCWDYYVFMYAVFLGNLLERRSLHPSNWHRVISLINAILPKYKLVHTAHACPATFSKIWNPWLQSEKDACLSSSSIAIKILCLYGNTLLFFFVFLCTREVWL